MFPVVFVHIVRGGRVRSLTNGSAVQRALPQPGEADGAPPPPAPPPLRLTAEAWLQLLARVECNAFGIYNCLDPPGVWGVFPPTPSPPASSPVRGPTIVQITSNVLTTRCNSTLEAACRLHLVPGGSKPRGLASRASAGRAYSTGLPGGRGPLGGWPPPPPHTPPPNGGGRPHGGPRGVPRRLLLQPLLPRTGQGQRGRGNGWPSPPDPSVRPGLACPREPNCQRLVLCPNLIAIRTVVAVPAGAAAVLRWSVSFMGSA